MADVLDYEREEKNKAREYAEAAVDKLKDKGKELLGRMRPKDPMQQLEEAYCKEQLAKKNENLIKKTGKLIKKYDKEIEAKSKRLSKKNPPDVRLKLEETVARVQKSKAEQEQLRDRETNKVRSPKQMEAELKKHRENFNSMSDEQKVDYAIKLANEGKPTGKEFLNAVVDDENLKLSEAAQEKAGKYLHRETKRDAVEIKAENKMQRDGAAWAHGKSTIEIGEDNAKLAAADNAKDPRKSFLRKDSAKSFKKMDEKLKEEGYTRER